MDDTQKTHIIETKEGYPNIIIDVITTIKDSKTTIKYKIANEYEFINIIKEKHNEQ